MNALVGLGSVPSGSIAEERFEGAGLSGWSARARPYIAVAVPRCHASDTWEPNLVKSIPAPPPWLRVVCWVRYSIATSSWTGGSHYQFVSPPETQVLSPMW